MELLNKVEIDLSEYTIEELNDIEKAKLKKSIRKYIRKKEPNSIGVKKKNIAICLVLAILGISSSVVIAGINVLGYDFEYLLGVDKGTFEDYKTVINKVIYDEDTYVRLNEVIIDNSEIMINATFQFDDPPLKDSNSRYLSIHSKIYINGKQLDNSEHGILQKVSDTQFVSDIEHSIKQEAIPEGDMHIKIIFSDIQTHDKIFDGKWVFEFDTNRKQLLADLQNYEINNSFIIEDSQKVDILNVELTKIATIINFKVDSTEYEVGFKVEDDFGNLYRPYGMSILYSKGNIGYERLEAIDKNATQLIITPYCVLQSKSSGKGPDLEAYKLLTEEQFLINIITGLSE